MSTKSNADYVTKYLEQRRKRLKRLKRSSIPDRISRAFSRVDAELQWKFAEPSMWDFHGMTYVHLWRDKRVVGREEWREETGFAVADDELEDERKLEQAVRSAQYTMQKWFGDIWVNRSARYWETATKIVDVMKSHKYDYPEDELDILLRRRIREVLIESDPSSPRWEVCRSREDNSPRNERTLEHFKSIYLDLPNPEHVYEKGKLARTKDIRDFFEVEYPAWHVLGLHQVIMLPRLGARNPSSKRGQLAEMVGVSLPSLSGELDGLWSEYWSILGKHRRDSYAEPLGF